MKNLTCKLRRRKRAIKNSDAMQMTVERWNGGCMHVTSSSRWWTTSALAMHCPARFIGAQTANTSSTWCTIWSGGRVKFILYCRSWVGRDDKFYQVRKTKPRMGTRHAITTIPLLLNSYVQGVSALCSHPTSAALDILMLGYHNIA